MIIGITGGIGSGKSYIARGLAKQGFVIYDCDQEAKRIIEQDPIVKERISALLGDEVYADGKYQTKVVADKVFNAPTLLQSLNAIVHPVVKEDILRKAATCHMQPATLVVESAILWESGLDIICDKIVAVVADEEIRLQRAIARDHSNINRVRARMRAQMSDKERCKRADIIVNNNGQTPLNELCQYIMQHL